MLALGKWLAVSLSQDEARRSLFPAGHLGLKLLSEGNPDFQPALELLRDDVDSWPDVDRLDIRPTHHDEITPPLAGVGRHANGAGEGLPLRTQLARRSTVCDRPRSQALSGAGGGRAPRPTSPGLKGDLSDLLNAWCGRQTVEEGLDECASPRLAGSRDSRDVRRWSADADSPSVLIRRVTEI
jgi:hypothetical protein